MLQYGYSSILSFVTQVNMHKKYNRQDVIERIGVLLISQYGQKIERLFKLQPNTDGANIDVFDRMILAGLATNREAAIRMAAIKFKSCDITNNGKWNQLARWSLDFERSPSPALFRNESTFGNI